MSTVVSKEKLKVFETILSSPGMSDKCKVNLVMSRQNILLLSRLIETGLMINSQEIKDELLTSFAKESLDEFKTVHEDILKKSNLTEFYEKLKSL